eukprot:7723625-Alexandrium_andersonii.AAC.1
MRRSEEKPPGHFGASTGTHGRGSPSPQAQKHFGFKRPLQPRQAHGATQPGQRLGSNEVEGPALASKIEGAPNFMQFQPWAWLLRLAGATALHLCTSGHAASQCLGSAN